MKDGVVQKLIALEVKRQQETIDLIASENYVSPDILRIIGSPLINKYSEGYPGKRYYPGNQYYDEIETIARERALKAFKLSSEEWLSNVQPYSGSPANLAIYSALMQPGETLMGMKLAAGGHLTHGHKVSFTGKFFNSVQYGVDEKTGLLDYKNIQKLAKEYKPKVIVSGTTAYPRKIDFKKIGEIAKSVGAYHVADISHIAGLVLAGLHPNPFPYADAVMTTTHKTLRGPRGAVIFARNSPLLGHPEPPIGGEGSRPVRPLPRRGRLAQGRDSSSTTKVGTQNDKNITIAEAIDKAVFPGLQGGPHNNLTAAKALMFFEALQPAFKTYQRQILKNSQALAGELKKLGFNLVTGGTDNHLMLVDLRETGLDGKVTEQVLEKNNINANRNSIPGDDKPLKPSGIRIGTPAITTRGMKEQEMKKIAKFIYGALIEKQNLKKEIVAFCKNFPLPY